MRVTRPFELKSANLSFFGWLSLALTIISVPFFLISAIIGLANPDQTQANPISSLTIIAYTLGYIAVFHFFRILLNKKYHFHKADRAISAFVYLNLLLTVAIEVMGYIEGLEIAQTFFIFGSLVPLGILSIIMGIRLLSFENALHGIKKSLCISLITAGIMYASVVLFLVAIIPTLIITALLGVLFLREASTIEQS